MWKTSADPDEDKEPYGVVLKVTHLVMNDFPSADRGEVEEEVKRRCGQLEIAYAHSRDLVARAFESAVWQRKFKEGR